MKWKRMKKKEKTISSKKDEKAKQTQFVHVQKKSVTRGVLNSGPALRNLEIIDLKKDHCSKKESRRSTEQEELHSKDFTSKKSSRTSNAEKSQTAKQSEVVMKRRRRTKIEMALSYEAKNPHLFGHILEEVEYDCSANLERCVRGKSNNVSGCMKGRGNFWILDDNLICNVQKKMETLENQNIQLPQPTTKPVPLLGLKCFSIQRASVSMNKELDVVTIGKTIIQVSRAPPAKNKVLMNKEPSKALVQLDTFAEASGFEQTHNVTAVNNLNSDLDKSVQNKDTGVSRTIVEQIDCNLMPANRTEVHEEKQFVVEKCAPNICDAVEDVAVAGASLPSIQLDEMCSGELIKAVHSMAGCIEDGSRHDYSGFALVSDLEMQGLETGQNAEHSQLLNRCNGDGLTRLEERNGTLCKHQKIITFCQDTVERISQEDSALGNDNDVDVIQMNCVPVVEADICFLNSVSLARCDNVGAVVTNDTEKAIKTASAELEMDVQKMHRRKRKQLFTRRKKCKNASSYAAKLKLPSADSCNLWSFQNSITDQVLSVGRLAEKGRVGEMEISPEVESAASVLAMMSTGGRMFTGFQRGERWESEGPLQKHPNIAWTECQQTGTYMCEVCGHVFLDFAMLRQHIHEHDSSSQKSMHRKQLCHKQTTTKSKVQRTSLSADSMHSAIVKSFATIIDGSDNQLQNVQNLECNVQQPVAAVTQPIFMDVKLSQCDDTAQIVGVDHGGTIANVSVESMTNNEAVVKLNEALFDKSEIALKDVNLNQDNGILKIAEVSHVQLGERVPFADAKSVVSTDAAQYVGLNRRLSDKTGVDSTSKTNVTNRSRTVVGGQDIVGISQNEKECIYVGNAKENRLNMKRAMCNSNLDGQDMCEPDHCESTDLPHGTTKELNSIGQKSALVDGGSDVYGAEPQSSRFAANDVQLLKLVEQVVGTMKESGAVFGSEFSFKTIAGAGWAANVCCICNRKFCNAANARKHIRMQHHSYRPHKCKICGKGFPYPSSLVEHMTSHATDPRKLVCELCGKVFVRQSGLSKHIKEQHEKTRPHACNVCDKRFIYRCLLREHQRSHSDERTFKCTKCDCVFKQTSNLQLHIKRRHQNVCACPDGNCVCPTKPPRPMPTYECVVCSKMFHIRKQLEIHLDKHAVKTPLTCKICEKEFPNKFALSKHRMKHQETKTYSCEVCSRNFLSKQALKSHRGTHAGIKPYQCESCGKQYTTKNSLKIHSIRHLEVLPHACDKCNKTFALRTNLTKHMAIHTKEHVFVCCHCDQTFYCNSDLKKHILQHEEQKTYVCSYCSKKFLHQSNLNMHVVKHTGERAHSCGVCGRCFSLKANLRRHMQTHMRKNGHIIAESSIPIPGAYVVLGPE